MVRLSKDQRNHVFGVLKAGSTVDDIAHRLGCSRQTIDYLMNRYNITGYVRVRGRPGHARVTTLRSYLVNTLTHTRDRFKRQQALLGFTGVHAHKTISHFVQNNGPGIFQHDNTRPHTTRE